MPYPDYMTHCNRMEAVGRTVKKVTYSIKSITSKATCQNIKYNLNESWKKSEKLVLWELFLKQVLELLGKGVIVENVGKKSKHKKSILKAGSPDIGNRWRDIKMSIKILLGKIAWLKSFTADLASVAHYLFMYKGRTDNTHERLLNIMP